VRVEQEKGNFAGIEAGLSRDTCEWWGLIGRRTRLGRRHHVASLAPPMSDPKPIGGIGSHNWRIRQNGYGSKEPRGRVSVVESTHSGQSPQSGENNCLAMRSRRHSGQVEVKFVGERHN
jgi:hypothetical protein